MQQRYFGYFDWLRFALALAVAISHFHLLPWEAGGIAVRAFFALSGWLIGGILLRSETKELPRFFFNRATRIWIPYIACLLLLYGVSALLEGFTVRKAEIMFYDMTFVREPFAAMPSWNAASKFMAFGGAGVHLWSISIEEQFYLIAPIAILMTRFGKNPIFWLCVSSLLVALHSEFSAISLGVTAAALQYRYGDWHLTIPVQLALCVVTIASASFLYYEAAWPFFGIGIVLLLARPFPKMPTSAFLGGLSYPLYLNHWIAEFASKSAVKHFPVLLPVLDILSVIVALMFSVVMYLAIDRQVMQYRDAVYSNAIAGRLRFAAYAILAIGMAFGTIRWYLLPSIAWAG